MIFKRAVAKLRAQDWSAIAIELVIVIVGVFVGTWVANWNQDRVEQAETRKMVARLDPTLRQLTDYFQSARIYYDTTRAYSDTAIAGWRGDRSVSDADFESLPIKQARYTRSGSMARPGRQFSARIAFATSTNPGYGPT